MSHPYVADRGHLDLARSNVLVVEDHKSTQIILRDILRSLGFGRIYIAENIATAVDMLRVADIDLMLMDLVLSSEDGLALLSSLRRDKDGRIAKLPVVVVSANATASRVVEAGAHGVAGFVAKPITVAALAHRIGEALSPPRLPPQQVVAI